QTAPLWDYVRYITFWALWALVFSFIQQQLADRLAYQIEFDMRVWLYTHIQSADLRRLDQVATGQLVTRSLTDIQLVDTLLRVFPTLIGYAPILLSVAVIVTIISPLMGVVSILALPINIWLVNKFRTKLRALSWAELNERAEVTTAIDEPVRGIRVVKAFGREEYERARVAAVALRVYRYAMTRARLLARLNLPLKALPVLTQALLLYVGARLVADDHITLGTFLIAFQLATFTTQLGAGLDGILSTWQYFRSAQDRLREVIEMGNAPPGAAYAGAVPSFDGASGLVVDDVDVRFD